MKCFMTGGYRTSPTISKFSLSWVAGGACHVNYHPRNAGQAWVGRSGLTVFIGFSFSGLERKRVGSLTKNDMNL